MKKIFFALVALAMCGCASQNPDGLTSPKQLQGSGLPVDHAAQARRDVFVGRWYDRQNARDGSQTMSLMDIKLDGTYSESWRTLEKNGQLRTAKEEGRWGASGSIFFTITTARAEGDGELVAVDQRDAYFYDAYFIESASATENSIRHIISGDEFVSRRVGGDFSFPSF